MNFSNPDKKTLIIYWIAWVAIVACLYYATDHFTRNRFTAYLAITFVAFKGLNMTLTYSRSRKNNS